MVNNIIKIFDENNNEIKFNNLEIKLEKTKRSSIISKILYIDNIPIIGVQRNFYRVLFKCNCGNLSNVNLKYYLSKNDIHCGKCQNRHNVHKYKNVKKIINYNWDDYDETFKNKYWKRHLKLEEFLYFKDKIVSINNKSFINVIYYEHLPINNQNIFTSFVSFDNGLTKESLKSIELLCEVCNKTFSIHPFNIRKFINKHIKCKKCNFNTKEYEIKLYKNTNITYQSLLELSFLNKCFEYNINVMNGFEIPYFFNNKIRTYITDFYLPDYKYIIEIKGSNPYYFKDIKSGRLDAKNNAAISFAKNNNMEFKFILDDINIFFNEILK